MSEISYAGTFKLKKQDLQVEGFNPHHIKDQLYFLMGGQYVPLTEKLHDDIINGRLRL
jgi:solute carrier family 27 fatty acid transporter 1/4